MHNEFGVTVIFHCQLGFVNSLRNQTKEGACIFFI
jgi:hypothetical protein